MNATVLVAEDDARIADLVCRYLAMEKFSYQVASNGIEAIALFEKYKPDLVVLDILLPKVDGATVCEKIRAISDVPVIMVTALGKDEDKLQGFSKGADDYVCKPFNPRELMARIKAILRRSGAEARVENSLSLGALHMNLDERTLKVDGNPVVLTQIEFGLLEILLAQPNRVFSREELLDRSHGNYTEAHLRSIDFHIKNLRRKINISDKCRFIKAVYGIGYRLL